jgi:hypothetical protein
MSDGLTASSRRDGFARCFATRVAALGCAGGAVAAVPVVAAYPDSVFVAAVPVVAVDPDFVVPAVPVVAVDPDSVVFAAVPAVAADPDFVSVAAVPVVAVDPDFAVAYQAWLDPSLFAGHVDLVCLFCSPGHRQEQRFQELMTTRLN